CQYRLTTTVHSPRPPFSLPSCSFLSTFFFYCSVPPRALHSFPTRRSSDLTHGVRLDQFYPTPAAVDPYHLARRAAFGDYIPPSRSEEHTSELQSRFDLVCRLLLEKKKKKK